MQEPDSARNRLGTDPPGTIAYVPPPIPCVTSRDDKILPTKAPHHFDSAETIALRVYNAFM